MELLNLQHVSPESIRDGMVTHEDPLSDEVPFAEGYARAKQKAQELDGYASLFGEMPSSVTPAKGREILNQEGFEYRDSFDQVEQYHDARGIVARFVITAGKPSLSFTCRPSSPPAPCCSWAAGAPSAFSMGTSCSNTPSRPSPVF